VLGSSEYLDSRRLLDNNINEIASAEKAARKRRRHARVILNRFATHACDQIYNLPVVNVSDAF
jgi:hypothetical protein